MAARSRRLGIAWHIASHSVDHSLNVGSNALIFDLAHRNGLCLLDFSCFFDGLARRALVAFSTADSAILGGIAGC